MPSASDRKVAIRIMVRAPGKRVTGPSECFDQLARLANENLLGLGFCSSSLTSAGAQPSRPDHNGTKTNLPSRQTTAWVPSAAGPTKIPLTLRVTATRATSTRTTSGSLSLVGQGATQSTPTQSSCLRSGPETQNDCVE